MADKWTDLIGLVRATLQSLNNLSSTLGKVFPQWNGTTATTATAGTNGALPAQVAGYLVVVNPVTGASVRIPFYNP